MFQLINSHLQAYSLQVKSRDAVKNRPEDGCLLVETYTLHITLCNDNNCADVQLSITIRIQALRDVSIQSITDFRIICTYFYLENKGGPR